MNPQDRIDELKGILQKWDEWNPNDPPLVSIIEARIKELEQELPEPDLYARDELGRRPIDIHRAEQWIDDRHLRDN